jgi:hypothetical protein
MSWAPRPWLAAAPKTIVLDIIVPKLENLSKLRIFYWCQPKTAVSGPPSDSVLS